MKEFLGRFSQVPSQRSGMSLAVVFMVVIGSFLGSSLFVQRASSKVADHSDLLATNIIPSIETLADVRGAALQTEFALVNLLGGNVEPPVNPGSVDHSLVTLRSAIQAYLALPLSPAERGVHDPVQQAWARFEYSAVSARNLADAGEQARARWRIPDVQSSADSLVSASAQAIEFYSRTGRLLAEDIRSSRRRSTLVGYGLTALCVLLGLIGAILLQRQARIQNALNDERTRALEERAEELEQFAGRVAHDIRGPIGAASLAADLLSLSEKSEEVRSIAARLKRSLGRANAITTDLLQFARAGAKPDPGARTSPRSAIADLAPELDTEAANQRVVLRWQPMPPVMVACSQGVYLSLVGNLVRNAIKYMGESSTRRITVSVTDDGTTVRTEVADTGPGISKDQLPSLFEPYFRGDNTAGREGIGLGLPTVRKLAEGHGGHAGVSSTPGSGSIFWFTLPRAGSAPTDLDSDPPPVQCE